MAATGKTREGKRTVRGTRFQIVEEPNGTIRLLLPYGGKVRSLIFDPETGQSRAAAYSKLLAMLQEAEAAGE